MGDFLLDLRPLPERRMAEAVDYLKFCEDVRVSLIEAPEFSLLLTSTDDARTWGAFQSADGNILTALCGRVAFDEKNWARAQRTPGEGGLACKAIFNLYQDGGEAALGELNGNFVAFLLDRAAGTARIITDRCGMMIAYGKEELNETLVFSSHPDALAAVTDEAGNWDFTSLAQFVMTGGLTFPYTYYDRIRGLDMGTVFKFAVSNGALSYQSKFPCSGVDFQGDRRATVDDLAGELVLAYQKAVQRRTLPVLGETAIALSGGVDSRLILSMAMGNRDVRAFHLYNEQNLEFQTAKALAAACGVDYSPIQRDFDYYGRTAELGVKISGGTGSIASNHFLGTRNWLKQAGVQNLLTGCYCDYLFKGLALNTVEQKFSRKEKLRAFDFEFYRPCYWPDGPHRNGVMDRLRDCFPEANKPEMAETDWEAVERKRSFPLAYEGDLAQRVIPQRVMPWYPPVVDNDVINVYRKIPSRLKLNGAVFKKAALMSCQRNVRRIPDSNTGAPLEASPLRYSLHRYSSALRNRIHDRLLPRMGTRGSWPNWEYYILRSRIISSLWQRNKGMARDFFLQIVGQDPYSMPVREYRGGKVELFLRLLTLKLWLEQRLPAREVVPVESKMAIRPD